MVRATYHDLFEILSYQTRKTGMEMRQELEEKGLKAGHMRGAMYVHLNQWREEGIIDSAQRALPEDALPGQLPPQREYWRISSGIPKELQEDIGGLEQSMLPTH